ncbi:prenyltransferase [Methanobacterium sp. CWC-01]|nr:prenyltransferase [Methanobacterium sp. CWC-01]
MYTWLNNHMFSKILGWNQFRALVKMGRPFVLVAGLIAYFLGLSIAYHDQGTIHIVPALVGLLILVLATLMAHYANEYADVDTDTITRRTRYSGGSGVLPSGIIPPSWAFWSAVILAIMTLIFTFSSFLWGLISSQVVVIVLVGMWGGWFYSMPPLQLERTMWGELDNALLGGYLMPLIAYIPQVGVAEPEMFLILTPIFLAVLVNLLGVHWLDREADGQVGKNTLVVRLAGRVPLIHLLLTVLMYLVTLSFWTLIPWQVIVAILLTIPLAVWANLRFKQSPQYSSILMSAVMIFAGVGWIIA